MQETIQQSVLWEHTITKIFKHDPESELDIMIRQWVIYNKLEDSNSLMNYTDEDLIPHGHGCLSFYKENGDFVVKMMSPSTFQFSISIWNVIVRSLSCFPISCSPLCFGGSISVTDLSSDKSSS